MKDRFSVITGLAAGGAGSRGALAAAARRLVIIAVAGLMAACSAVYTTKPVGDAPLPVTEEEWGGTWLGPGGALTVTVNDAAKGVLDIAWVERRQDRLELESHRVWLAQSGDWSFASAEDKDHPGLYAWGHFVRDGEQLIVWIPDPARAKTMVEHGALRGHLLEADGDDVVLEPPTRQDLERIMAPGQGAFEWRRAVAFIRVAQ